ncbi:MAG: malate dehydrogenase [Candidatus Woykebacteria bacterium RBG_16_44_10]|uniref:Malate dehydrogenase n=1 Tax=Candidatus Woykebacteria bacterium RBG_16_44_10 TaxID=1802597 RepID=A0A1G1WEF4_9BACT|nr:MAG: malate dehydrogenase [Candidatus Woykebacteria bacterium RBG_16_44_10]
MDFSERALKSAIKRRGKIEIALKVKIKNREDLSTYYTPGVAAVSLEVAKNKERVFELTNKGNSIAVVSDGTSVLGLGDIGPEAALPVMEGKCLLFKELAGIDAFPIVLGTKNVDEIVSIVKAIAPSFGGINLEDIAAPACFEVEEKLQNISIPVFHDDQHGTAVVVSAALINALKVVGKKISDIKVVIFGAGAAGIATAKLIKPGCLVMVDSRGPINETRKDINKYKKEITQLKNYFQASSLEEAFEATDVFIGVSGRGRVTSELIKRMNPDPIIFALSNPNPEILPKNAKAAGAAIVATGRSDFPNQINNILAFPGIFRGALDSHAKGVNLKMKLKAAEVLAGMITKPTPNKILPSPLDKNVVKTISKAIVSL